MDTNRLEERLLNSREVKKIREERRLAYNIADMIVDARAKRGITQKELAEKVGTKQPSIARIEAGEKLPSLTFLEKIAKALNTEIIAPKFQISVENINYMSTSPIKEFRFQISNNLSVSFQYESKINETDEEKVQFTDKLMCHGGLNG